MTYSELESIAVGLYGSHWKQPIIAALGASNQSIQNWKAQGVPKWVAERLPSIGKQRLAEVRNVVERMGKC